MSTRSFSRSVALDAVRVVVAVDHPCHRGCNHHPEEVNAAV